MQTKKNAIVFIPGLDAREKNSNLRRLVNGFLSVPENATVEATGESKVAGESGIQLNITVNGEEALVDVYEANWWDLTVFEADENPLKKMKQGFSLLTYWFFSRIWRTIRKSPYMMIGVLLSSLILIFWYYGVLVLAFSAIGSNPEMVTSVNPGWGTDAARTIGKLGNAMGGWYVWAAASFLIGFLPVNSLIRISGFTKRYLQNEPMEDGIGLRDKIRNRVKDTIANILNDGSYDRLTILSHSFGTVVGVDILADFNRKQNHAIRFVTIGSPAYFLSHRSAWIKAEVEKCLANGAIVTWLDFYSDEDWLCSKIPGHGEGDKTNQESIAIHHAAPLIKKLYGDTHLAYFSSQAVLEKLVALNAAVD